VNGTEPPETLVVIVGGDTLAQRVCEELMETRGQSVTVVWHRDDGLRAKVERLGARFVRGSPFEEETLHAAEIGSAGSILALTDDDELNMRVVLLARDLNARVRIVLRQFNRTLGRKVERNLPDCSVVSLSAHSAATYASAAVDPNCYFGLQFPDIDGPLIGFAIHPAGDYGVSSARVAAVERTRGIRILAVGNDLDVDPERVIEKDDLLTVVAQVQPVRRVLRKSGAEERGPFAAVRLLWRRVRDEVASFDRVVRAALLAAAVVFILGATYFGITLHLDPLTAVYFVMATMTTTGYGDITPREGDKLGELMSMGLMLGGIIFSGIFIAILTARFAEIQFRETQGLRQVRMRGHVLVCGSGNVGARVIEFLVRLGVPIVVVELEPKPEIVARAKAGEFQLLTGSAASDTTLDLCNLGEAEAVVALTNSDTLNLEIGLGARARNETLPIVLRVSSGAFASSISAHFQLYRTHGTAALAAPVFAGLSRFGGVRGRVTVAGRAFSIGEFVEGSDDDPRAVGIPIAVWHDGHVRTIRDFSEARAGDRVLFLYPVWRYRRDGAPSERASALRIALPPTIAR
jgi:Trk K+ transport system NAD-binding subunit